MGNGGALSPNRLKLTAPSVHGSCLVQVDDHHEDLLPRKSAIHPTGLSDVSMRIKGQRPRPPVGKPRGLSPGVTTKTQKSLLRGGLDTETTGYRGGNILMARLGTHWISAEGGRGGGQKTGRPDHENQSPRRKPPGAVGALSIDQGSHGKEPVFPAHP